MGTGLSPTGKTNSKRAEVCSHLNCVWSHSFLKVPAKYCYILETNHRTLREESMYLGTRKLSVLDQSRTVEWREQKPDGSEGGGGSGGGCEAGGRGVGVVQCQLHLSSSLL